MSLVTEQSRHPNINQIDKKKVYEKGEGGGLGMSLVTVILLRILLCELFDT